MKLDATKIVYSVITIAIGGAVAFVAFGIESYAEGIAKRVYLAENQALTRSIKRIDETVQTMQVQQSGQRSQMFEAQRQQERFQKEIRQDLRLIIDKLTD